MRTYYYFVFRFAENILQLCLKQILFAVFFLYVLL